MTSTMYKIINLWSDTGRFNLRNDIEIKGIYYTYIAFQLSQLIKYQSHIYSVTFCIWY